MKIVLVISDTKHKNMLFATDDGKVLPAMDAMRLARSGSIEGVHVATRGGVPYLRARRNAGQNGIDQMTVTARRIVLANDRTNEPETSIAGLRPFLEAYQDRLARDVETGGTLITVGSVPITTEGHIEAALKPCAQYIFDASQKFSVDPYLLGGIVADEIARIAPFEDVIDPLLGAFSGLNISVGVAQVKLDTACEVIRKGYFDPNPDDVKLHPRRVTASSRRYLFTYVADMKNNVYFAAAHARHIIDYWQASVEITIAPDIIATLYSRGLGDPKSDPKPSERGSQIVKVFVPIAKWILGGV